MHGIGWEAEPGVRDKTRSQCRVPSFEELSTPAGDQSERQTSPGGCRARGVAES